MVSNQSQSSGFQSTIKGNINSAKPILSNAARPKTTKKFMKRTMPVSFFYVKLCPIVGK